MNLGLVFRELVCCRLRIHSWMLLHIEKCPVKQTKKILISQIYLALWLFIKMRILDALHTAHSMFNMKYCTLESTPFLCIVVLEHLFHISSIILLSPGLSSGWSDRLFCIQDGLLSRGDGQTHGHGVDSAGSHLASRGNTCPYHSAVNRCIQLGRPVQFSKSWNFILYHPYQHTLPVLSWILSWPSFSPRSISSHINKTIFKQRPCVVALKALLPVLRLFPVFVGLLRTSDPIINGWWCYCQSLPAATNCLCSMVEPCNILWSTGDKGHISLPWGKLKQFMYSSAQICTSYFAGTSMRWSLQAYWAQEGDFNLMYIPSQS